MCKFKLGARNNETGLVVFMKGYENYTDAKNDCDTINEIEPQTGLHFSVYVYVDSLGMYVNDEAYNGVGKYM